jgi:glycosyltransferase involved in cell wall biosynthesis
MKIALIGNMNNNNFSLMRYFRDLGADAHLLLYHDDGLGDSDHFKPEMDTWNIHRWLPFIHKTEIPNTIIAAYDFPISWFMSFRSWVRNKMGLANAWRLPISRRKILETYHGYDVLVGSGITPATLLRVGISLDIFYPYSLGVEFYRSKSFLNDLSKLSSLSRFLIKLCIRRQKEGIKKANYVLNSCAGFNSDVLVSLGVKSHVMSIPMVYVDNDFEESLISEDIRILKDKILQADFTILHHARLMWNFDSSKTNNNVIQENKNNDWLIHAFFKLVKERPGLKIRLIILEYGPDVDLTKRLITSLGMDDYVDWVQKKGRREIMWLLSQVSLAVGEFYETPKAIWGGTGWETLASGKPLLQGFNFSKGEFENIYGYPPPPMLPVRKASDIYKHLCDMIDQPNLLLEIGCEAKAWFDKYNGIGLAEKWLDILSEKK